MRILCNRSFKSKVGSFIISLKFASIKETNPVSGRSGQGLGGGVVGLRKGWRRRKRMGTGVEIGQAWVVMKMESWVIFVCVSFSSGKGPWLQDRKQGGTKAPSDWP